MRVRHGGYNAQGQKLWAGVRSISIAEGMERCLRELRAMSISEEDCIVSTNLLVRLDGLPRGDQAEPSDPGAAVYWEHKGRRECIAIDRYTRVADNAWRRSHTATLEALRAIERHGGGEILERAFQGFAALPESTSGKNWRDILNFHPSEKPSGSQITNRFPGTWPRSGTRTSAVARKTSASCFGPATRHFSKRISNKRAGSRA